MAVKDDGSYYPTESIVSKRARKHFRVPVRSQHWQLRSLISADKQHIIYFPGGHGSFHVQRLNTRTHECETIKLLTFAPRCLVAKNGWLCCGSESGDFVAIRLDESNEAVGSDSSARGATSAMDLDARLPFGLDLPAGRDESIASLVSQARRVSHKSSVAKSMRLAKERVNCITLWFPPASMPVHKLAYKQPVAVLANNDRTVTIVSLYDFDANEKIEPMDIIHYPDYVNRAVISPDGRLLIAILDDPYLYVHERIEASPEDNSASGYRWELKRSLLLKSQIKGDKSDSRGSFAACFSSTGAYLAVGTQHGTISIFDVTRLTEDHLDPVITTFKSSRPDSGAGAVRDMAFCPGPYDVLAWTEDRGHIGVADMRSNFMVRQIIDINVEADFEHIGIHDRNTIDPRLLEARVGRRDLASVPGVVRSTVAAAISSTFSRRGGVVDSDSRSSSAFALTPSEMRARESAQSSSRASTNATAASLGTVSSRRGPVAGPSNTAANDNGDDDDIHTLTPLEMRAREMRRAAAAGSSGLRSTAGQASTSTSSASSSRAEREPPSNTPAHLMTPSEMRAREARQNQNQNQNASTISSSFSRRDGFDSVNHPFNSDETQVLEAMQDQRLRRERSSQTGTEEGSRNSSTPSWTFAFTEISPNDGEFHRLRDRSSSVSRAVRNARQVTANRRAELRADAEEAGSSAPSRADRQGSRSSYLNIIELIRARELPSTDAEMDEASVLAPLVNQVVSRWEESAIRGSLPPDYGVFEVPPTPDNTAGLAWSQDGRTLFVGAQNGIYELHLNVESRKFCPSISMR